MKQTAMSPACHMYSTDRCRSVIGRLVEVLEVSDSIRDSEPRLLIQAACLDAIALLQDLAGASNSPSAEGSEIAG